MEKIEWKQNSSRFDKNPAKYTAEIMVRERTERRCYCFYIIAKREGVRWLLAFDPCFTEMFPKELGEMSGGEAKAAAKILCEEAVQKLVNDLETLDKTNGALSSEQRAAHWWRSAVDGAAP